ncbi:hypothetical protein NEMBOFW57_005604 [Staphylotrichum longicolle]|uniref:Uncharacterized protein n=1 Tax=Staphylotrichum longicolle TaxID=669026 RepID=A0AAD4EXT5_9PEZI|nr:hypothetical protein NEMBOFW57_005604 [Staphylotrichum longicolle]
MARLALLFAALSWLAVSQAQEQVQQVLNDDPMTPHPLPQAAEVVRKKLKKAEIIPTGKPRIPVILLSGELSLTGPVIDDFSPSLGLHASWPSRSGPARNALLGNTLKSTSRKSRRPSASSTYRNVSYVITLTDPDAPSRDDPKWSEFLPLGCVRHPETLSATPRPGPCPPVLTDLDEVMRTSPGPAEKTASIAINGTTDKLHLSKPSDRKHWGYDPKKGKTKGVREWAEENGLAPVGANFIYAKNKKQ